MKLISMAFNSDYPKKLSHALNDLREQKQLCDVIINVGGRPFHAHKAVLAASGRYFRAMFTMGYQETIQREVKIGVSAEVFEVLLQFIYTGQLNVTTKMAHDILDVACYMQLTDVFKPFSTFIRDCVTAKSNEMAMGDAFKIYNLAKSHDLTKLVQSLEKYMEDNVQDLKKTDVFLENASVTFLEKFLSRTELSSASEENQVLEMVVAWLKRDWKNRCGHTVCLFQKVRLGLVPTENLKELVDAEILEIPECKALLEKVLQLQSSKKSKAALSQQNPELFSTRSTITTPLSTFCWDSNENQTCRFQYFNAAVQRWQVLKRFPAIPNPTRYQSIIAVDGLLYAIGGLDCKSAVAKSDLFCYDPMKNMWTELPSMKIGRHRMSVVYLDGFIYAIDRDNGRMHDVERYDIALKKWEMVSRLPAKQIIHGVSAVAFKGNILVYVFMLDWVSRSVYEFVLYVYCPSTDTWQTVLSEEYDEEMVPDSNHGVLFVHRDVCYKITYLEKSVPSVNILNVELHDGNISVALGSSVKQDHIPLENEVNAFRIGDEVFVNHNRFVYNTGIKLATDQSTDVDLKEWESFIIDHNYNPSNVAWFTFDGKATRSENIEDEITNPSSVDPWYW